MAIFLWGVFLGVLLSVFCVHLGWLFGIFSGALLVVHLIGKGSMVHPTYLVFLALVGAFFWAVAAGSMLGAVAAYVSAGVALRTYEDQKPVFERPYWAVGREIPFLLTILFWPLRVRSAVYEYFRRLRRPNRFLIFDEDDRETRRFAFWNQAVAFARKRAAESGEIVHITDTGRLRKYRLRHDVFYAMYEVLPSGEVKKAPY